ncbi:MAG TPA: threonine--tRNA ligase [Erysipelotrichaceae bacterium]|nr:threonine--tRNA ligase [Erysipelotrichaceae bacterium]
MINILNDQDLAKLNHSAAHVMAQAIKRLYPQANFWVGPVITSGFYYDIDLYGEVISEADFEKIEREMKKISKDGKRISRAELSRKEALDLFKDDPYKVDLINELPEDEVISTYKQGEFIDLCRGPHVDTVKEVKYFKLLKVSGAYFKGDSQNKQLQRVYGIAFRNQEDLDNHLHLLEEAAKRDHKKLGRELDLFMMSEYSVGHPFFLDNGMRVIRELEKFWYDEHTKEDYQFIKTPVMLSQQLWEKSGHWANYKDNMYTTAVDDQTYAIKPMNCPGGMLVYKNSMHSYRDFPLRVGELGHVHRYEASGALNGLFRVRSFTQDDAHIFMTKDQIESETIQLMELIDRIYSAFNFEYRIELSTRPEDKFIGEVSDWDESERILEDVIKKTGREYQINEGDGAFYGPKIDFQIKDSLGREWQCGTIQLDMNLPERFDLTYVDDHGDKVRPIMLHRAIYGSLERFMGILIEHYAGAFPLWLAPKQIEIIPVNNEFHLEYSKQIKEKLQSLGFRVSIDSRDEKLGYRLREAQIMKVPVQMIIGDKEVEASTINVRRYGSRKQDPYNLEDYIEILLEEVSSKA